MSSKSLPRSRSGSLFPAQDSSRESPQTKEVSFVTANVDGGARGNPGPAGYGVYIRDASGAPIKQISEYIGHKTNNFAEYSALLAALQFAVDNGHKAFKVISDSELMVRQMTGRYRVSSPDLKPLYEKARALVRQLDRFSIEHVLRAQNKHADLLANEAMDRGMGKK